VPLTIFVHRASECLTDHLSHGDGLICFSLLNELAQRGNRIFAYTNRNGVHERPENMTILARRHIVPANSLGPWENAWRANRWLRRLQRQHQIDLVWRMHPYEGGCPAKPYTGKRPLVVGPLFYGWPQESSDASRVYGPRLGLGIGNLVAPLARRGWNRTLKAASLVLCATDSLAEQIRPLTRGRVITLPVIVDPPADLASLREPGRFPHLLFVANLVANKRPLVFCEMIQILRQKGTWQRARSWVTGRNAPSLSSGAKTRTSATPCDSSGESPMPTCIATWRRLMAWFRQAMVSRTAGTSPKP